jgi:hypothetical protein
MAVPLFPSFVAPPARRYLTPAAPPHSRPRLQKSFRALPDFNLIANACAPQQREHALAIRDNPASQR